MSKWSEEFGGTFSNTDKIRKMTYQMKKNSKEDVKKIREMLSKYKLKVLE